MGCSDFCSAGHFLPSGKAQELSIDLDQQKTKVGFVLSDVLHTVHRSFQLKQGHISMNRAANTMSGAIVVDAPVELAEALLAING